MEIQRNPVNAKGEKTSPVAGNELSGGSVRRLFDGYQRQAATGLYRADRPVEQPIRLEPMTTFPVVRDLVSGPEPHV